MIMWMLFALLLFCMHLLSPPSEQSESVEIVFLSDCASVCTQRTCQSRQLGHEILIAPQRLKLLTSNLTNVFLDTFRTLPLNIFRKAGVARITYVTPPKFLKSLYWRRYQESGLSRMPSTFQKWPHYQNCIVEMNFTLVPSTFSSVFIYSTDLVLCIVLPTKHSRVLFI